MNNSTNNTINIQNTNPVIITLSILYLIYFLFFFFDGLRLYFCHNYSWNLIFNELLSHILLIPSKIKSSYYYCYNRKTYMYVNQIETQMSDMENRNNNIVIDMVNYKIEI